MLLNAFERLPGDRYRLWITGDGECRRDVEAAAARDPRITYFGFLPYARVIELYGRAAILLNPHLTTVRSARYQFPSKILEYLAAGRPVVSTSTPGVAEEYGHVVRLSSADTPEAFAAAMQEAASLPFEARIEEGRRGREFVLEAKSWKRQGERIVSFIREQLEIRDQEGRAN